MTAQLYITYHTFLFNEDFGLLRNDPVHVNRPKWSFLSVLAEAIVSIIGNVVFYI